MLNTAEKVHAGNKITTHQDHANFNYLSNIAFMSKAELRKTIELMQMELNRLHKEHFLLREKEVERLKQITNYQREYLKMLDETEKKKSLDISYLQIAI